MAHTTMMKLLLGGALLMGLSACPGDDTGESDGDCDPTVEGDPDCLRDGECNVDDAEDPDCEACDYTPDAPECQPDPCDEPNPPPECDPFVPANIQVGGALAYDAATNKARSYFVGEDATEIAPNLSILFQDERWGTTSNVDYLCNLELTSTGGYEPEGAAFTVEISANEMLDHFGVTWPVGNYEILDAPYTAQAGQVEGCSSKYLDPAIYGDDVVARLNDREWGAGWGTMEGQIETSLTNTANDDPENDYDLFSLYAAGLACGGSQKVGESQNPYLVFLGYAVDDAWMTVPTEDENDPVERLPCSDMEPDGETGRPASGIYFIRPLGSWFGGPLLGVQ